MPGIDETAVLEGTRALVRAASENPPGDERKAAEVAAGLAREAGLNAEIVETAPGRANVIAVLDSGKAGRTLLWNGHIDVVPIVDESLWTHPPFEAVIEAGAMHGRGTADMKGACAAAIEAAAALNREGLPKKGKLVLHLVADEETLGPHGTRALHRMGRMQADAAIVGEPTQLQIGLAERGMLWVVARTTGIAAHGSRPDIGLNAIEKMAKVVLALRGMRPPRSHPLLGEPTLNVGTIAGGSKINIVAASCTIEIDRRTLPGETPEEIMAEMREAIENIGDPDVKCELEQIRYAPPCEIDASEEIVAIAKAVGRDVLGSDMKEAGMTFATDAHTLALDAGIPTMLLGPGSIEQAHTTNEFVAVADLYAAARVYAGIFEAYLEK